MSLSKEKKLTEKTLKWMAAVCQNCVICKHARKTQKGIAYNIAKLDAKICPFCKAYEKLNGKKSYEP